MKVIDLYELKAGNVVYERYKNQEVIGKFEVFTRGNKYPWYVLAGIGEALQFVKNLDFDSEDISFLKKTEKFTKDFLNELENLEFNGNIYAMIDGTIFFKNEPVFSIEEKIWKAGLYETAVLGYLQLSSVATKGLRIILAAREKPIVDFSPRGEFPDKSISSAKYLYIVGFQGTSNLEARLRYDIPVVGTMPHWMIQTFIGLEGLDKGEEKAFEEYSKIFGYQVALVDTMNIHEGIRKALKQGYSAVRIDSGNLDEIAKKVKAMFGKNIKVFISSGLDEEKILHIDADTYGVGRSVYRDKIDFVYKLVELEKDGERIPITKFSPGKKYLPHAKQVQRIEINGNYALDKIVLFEKNTPGLLNPVMMKGKISYNFEIQELRNWVAEQVNKFGFKENVEKSLYSYGYKIEVDQRLEEALNKIQCALC